MSKQNYEQGIKIFLNIYDLSSLNCILHPLGLGAYHSSIQIFDSEFSFYAHKGDQTGIIETEFSAQKQLNLRQQLLMGECTLKLNEVCEIIEDIKIEYIGSSYNVFTKNCHHFSDDFIQKLLKGRRIPNYLNRLAFYGQCCKCFVSKYYIYGGALPPSHRKTDSVKLATKRLKEFKNKLIQQNNNDKIKLLNDQQRESSTDQQIYSNQYVEQLQINKNLYNIDDNEEVNEQIYDIDSNDKMTPMNVFNKLQNSSKRENINNNLPNSENQKTIKESKINEEIINYSDKKNQFSENNNKNYFSNEKFLQTSQMSESKDIENYQNYKSEPEHHQKEDQQSFYINDDESNISYQSVIIKDIDDYQQQVNFDQI